MGTTHITTIALPLMLTVTPGPLGTTLLDFGTGNMWSNFSTGIQGLLKAALLLTKTQNSAVAVLPHYVPWLSTGTKSDPMMTPFLAP